MRAPPLLLLLFVPAALGCAGTVSSAAPGGDAEATTTIALVIVQRTVDATSARAQSSARFVRFAPSLSPDDALRAIGAAIDLPPIDTCASSAPVPAEATTDESPPVVELGDMGEVSLDADGASTRLVPRLLPDVTDVVRGEDLFMATGLHRLLQTLLDLPAPSYRHHAVLRDASGRKLSKSSRAKSIRALREEGLSPAAVRDRLSPDLIFAGDP